MADGSNYAGLEALVNMLTRGGSSCDHPVSAYGNCRRCGLPVCRPCRPDCIHLRSLDIKLPLLACEECSTQLDALSPAIPDDATPVDRYNLAMSSIDALQDEVWFGEAFRRVNLPAAARETLLALPKAAAYAWLGTNVGFFTGLATGFVTGAAAGAAVVTDVGVGSSAAAGAITDRARAVMGKLTGPDTLMLTDDASSVATTMSASAAAVPVADVPTTPAPVLEAAQVDESGLEAQVELSRVMDAQRAMEAETEGSPAHAAALLALCYAALEVEPEVETSACVKAYREKCRRFHPDKNRSPEATSVMQTLTIANACICDDDERKRLTALSARAKESAEGSSGGMGRAAIGVLSATATGVSALAGGVAGALVGTATGAATGSTRYFMSSLNASYDSACIVVPALTHWRDTLKAATATAVTNLNAAATPTPVNVVWDDATDAFQITLTPCARPGSVVRSVEYLDTSPDLNPGAVLTNAMTQLQRTFAELDLDPALMTSSVAAESLEKWVTSTLAAVRPRDERWMRRCLKDVLTTLRGEATSKSATLSLFLKSKTVVGALVSGNAWFKLWNVYAVTQRLLHAAATGDAALAAETAATPVGKTLQPDAAAWKAVCDRYNATRSVGATSSDAVTARPARSVVQTHPPLQASIQVIMSAAHVRTTPAGGTDPTPAPVSGSSWFGGWFKPSSGGVAPSGGPVEEVTTLDPVTVVDCNVEGAPIPVQVVEADRVRTLEQTARQRSLESHPGIGVEAMRRVDMVVRVIMSGGAPGVKLPRSEVHVPLHGDASGEGWQHAPAS